MFCCRCISPHTHIPPTPYKDENWGWGAAAAAGGPSALTDPAASTLAIENPVRAFGPTRSSRGTCASAKFALQPLVALASELRRLCSVNKLSDPRPQIHLFAHTQFLASAVALDPGGGGCVQTYTASLRALPDGLGLI